MWHNGYFTSSAAAVLVGNPGRPPSVVIRHVQRPFAQACRPLGWSICPLNTPSSLPRADVWSPENLHHQPVGDLFQFQSWLALSLVRQGRLSPWSTRALQPYTACKLTEPPWNGFLQPGILKHDHDLIFPPKTARDPRQRDMVACFWTAPTAWFQGGTGPNSEDSPCPSVTSYWCSAEGFYLTVFEHLTPLGKPLSRPSASALLLPHRPSSEDEHSRFLWKT